MLIDHNHIAQTHLVQKLSNKHAMSNLQSAGDHLVGTEGTSQKTLGLSVDRAPHTAAGPPIRWKDVLHLLGSKRLVRWWRTSFENYGEALEAWLAPLAVQREAMPGVYTGGRRSAGGGRSPNRLGRTLCTPECALKQPWNTSPTFTRIALECPFSIPIGLSSSWAVFGGVAVACAPRMLRC